MDQDPNIQKRASSFVLLTVFIYSAGFGIIMPALPDLIRELNGSSLSDATQTGAYIGAAYAFFQFAFGPTMGNLGDRFGRRPLFLFSLFGFGLDFLLMGFAPSIIWLFIGRSIAGGLGAIFGPAYAAMADLSDEKSRAASFGKVGAAFGIGFIAGPAAGGFLADISTRLPFFVAGGMAFANFIYGYFVFPETMPKEKQRPFEWRRANPLGALLSLRKTHSILPIAAVYFLWSFAGQIYPASWSFYAQAQFSWGTKIVGLSLTLVGISMAFFQAVALGKLVARFGERKTAHIGMLFGMAGFLTFIFMNNGIIALLLCFAMGAQGMVMPALNAMMSRRVAPEQQGELQGFNGSLNALAFFSAQLIFNYTLSYFTSKTIAVPFPGAPFVIASAFALVSIIILVLIQKAEPAASAV
jgi:MFS transporter, DHA1 family, tetracycline resistance protein